MKTKVENPRMLSFFFSDQALEMLLKQENLSESDLCHVGNVQNLKLAGRHIEAIVSENQMDKENVIVVLADINKGDIAESAKKAGIGLMSAASVKNAYYGSWSAAVA